MKVILTLIWLMLAINRAAGIEAKEMRNSQARNKDREPGDVVNMNRAGSSSMYLMERHLSRFKKHFLMGESYLHLYRVCIQ